MKLRTRIVATFFTIIVILIGVGVYAIVALKKTNDSTAYIATNCLPSVDVADTLGAYAANYRAAQFEHVIASSETDMSAWDKELSDLNDSIMKQVAKYKKELVSTIPTGD